MRDETLSLKNKLLESTLNLALDENSKYPVNIVKKFGNSFPVENSLTNVENEMELKNFIKIVTDIMAERKFDLRVWKCSKEEHKILEITYTLGMFCEHRNDTLGLKVSSADDYSLGKISKRIILAADHKIFDPLGIACPVATL